MRACKFTIGPLAALLLTIAGCGIATRPVNVAPTQPVATFVVAVVLDEWQAVSWTMSESEARKFATMTARLADRDESSFPARRGAYGGFVVHAEDPESTGTTTINVFGGVLCETAGPETMHEKRCYHDDGRVIERWLMATAASHSPPDEVEALRRAFE